MLWEYVSGFSTSNDVIRADALPDDDGVVDPEYYQLTPTGRSARFRANGMTQTEYDDLEAAVSPSGTVVSITDSTGKSWSGLFLSLTGETIRGTDYVGPVELLILIQ